ncbi:MAG: response regulator [Lachnospiraceae bacterium]|nr:response regulator [Lachnospiraceae bacterium]
MAKWIMVVDDDTTNLQMAGHILSKNNMRVTALKSGKAMLDYIDTKGVPDLVLLDIKMPEMDGFEALTKLRELEGRKGLGTIPVIFLTAEEEVDIETKGFEMGVADFIRKPFNPDVLLRRINNVISTHDEMKSIKEDASIDKLTGFLNKAATGTELSKMCADSTGCLMMLDLDSFKLVNDIYGHEAGDKILTAVARIIRDTVPEGSKNGRIGGDEFASFAINVTTEEEVAQITSDLNTGIVAKAKEILGADMNIPLGMSVGAVMVPKFGNDYNSLLKLADKSLYKVKKNGKHSYSIYTFNTISQEDLNSKAQTIGELSEIMGERSVSNTAMQLDMEAFSYVYRYVMRYVSRHGIKACKLLFTLDAKEGIDDETYAEACDEFGNHLRLSLRKSDIVTRNRYNQYYVFLTEFREGFIPKVVDQIADTWVEKHDDQISIKYESEFISTNMGTNLNVEGKSIVVVDDDSTDIKLTKKVLKDAGARVTAFESGQELLDFIDHNEEIPDLILLDIKMAGMSGFETLEQLRQRGSDVAVTPVIFITADGSEDAELTGLEIGALDFIRKPFAPEVLLRRVNNLLELVMLRKRYNRK